ncbi:hypothetical protein GV828_04630 [Flavobacterium sp. NST-5]|uniref:SGNH hydrolase-type esterase domain-containing protein n=1 Tax=Flavobacterium ichthyis TaxID=2698827 RepID=A0ABW9Z763_9FLAO|nr:SGNH/GDSL hydrolase family protein [Flavobacterium ichthyis]NBL64484.1 hypothetical protein [Flavobacterium ichthyis]
MNKSYFFQSFLIVLLATAAFIGFKQFLPKKLFPENTANAKNVLIDSLLLEAVDTNIASAKDTLVNEKIVFDETEGIVFPPEHFSDYKGYQHLIPFFEKLFQLENNPEQKVRIAYFGDSMTDGDMIVQDLRQNYQEKFGGEGVGFVSITSESAASRSSVTHQYSGNWKTQSYLNVKRPRSPFGVNGHVFFANDTANIEWIRFKANKAKFATMLNNPTLFYGKGKNFDGKVKVIIGKDTLTKTLSPHKLVNTLKIASSDLKAFKADFVDADSIPIFGFNFDNGKGVHVDNFSQRGNSGLPISTFNPEVMKAFNKQLNYDLIVLHYGTNVLNYGTKDYTWYDRSMTKTVNHLKECFPGVSILIVSTADKSKKYELEMKTDSAVVPLTTAQKRYALKTNSGFVNLYTLMGGEGSMVKWVEEEPAKANKDYTHFNFRGAKKIASLIFEELSQGYEKYKVLRKNRKPVAKKITDSATIKTDSLNE